MPLKKGEGNIGYNIREMINAGRPREQALAAALDASRRHREAGGAIGYASGGTPKKAFSGPVNGHGPGRTDRYPLQVMSGSYVIPADIVSALGEGNTAAGNEVIRRMFIKNTSLRNAGIGSKIERLVPCIVAGGEYIVPPDIVEQIGRGDIEKGHAMLDAFVKSHRKRTVKHLKALPPPVKD